MTKNSLIPGANQSHAVVHPEGDLVAARLPELRARLRELVRTGAQQITIDLSCTEMVDSAGIGLLISANNSLKASGGQLEVVRASQDVLELLKSMRLHQHFSISGKE
jgi:anti-anti-sigma factor